MLQETERERNSVFYLEQSRQCQSTNAFIQTSDWDGQQIVEIRHARLEHPIVFIQVNFTRNIANVGRDRGDNNTLKKSESRISRQYQHGTTFVG